MIDLAELLVRLTDSVPLSAGGAHAGMVIDVVTMEIDLPMEARLASDGSLVASFPRGRMATGFTIPHARLGARFAVRDE